MKTGFKINILAYPTDITYVPADTVVLTTVSVDDIVAVSARVGGGCILWVGHHSFSTPHSLDSVIRLLGDTTGWSSASNDLVDEIDAMTEADNSNSKED